MHDTLISSYMYITQYAVNTNTEDIHKINTHTKKMIAEFF